MSQPAPFQPDRRSEPRQPAAFAFWVRGERDSQRYSAWMHDLSASGAAFLTDARDTWEPGARLLFEPMRGDTPIATQTMPALPSGGHVVRVETDDGCIRRVAIRIETEFPSPGRSTPKVCDETTARPSVLPGQSFSPFDPDQTPATLAQLSDG